MPDFNTYPLLTAPALADTLLGLDVSATPPAAGQVKQLLLGTLLAQQTAQVYNVLAYGAAGNVVTRADGAITSAGHTLTSATGSFTAGDVGKLILVQGAGAAGASLATTISGFTSATSVTLTAAAGTTVSGATYYYGTDDSAAFAACEAAAAAAGGGICYVPAGQFMAASVPLANGIYWGGAGFDASKVYLTPGLSTSMFLAPSGQLNSGAVRDLGLYGDGTATAVQANTGGGIFVNISSTSTRTCLDLSAASLAQQVYIERCYIQQFGTGYAGSGNDRDVNWVSNRTWNCVTGVLLTLNHPIFQFSDFRFCGTGVSDNGNAIVDISFVATGFEYCNIGVNMPTGTITNGGRNLFTNVAFFGCITTGAVVSNQSTFAACQFNGYAGGTPVLAQLNGSQNVFTGCTFDGGWTTAAVEYLNTGAGCFGLVIEGCTFYADSVSSVATATILLNAGGNSVYGLVLSGNEATMTVDQTFLSVNNSTSLAHPTITGNSIIYTKNSAGSKTLYNFTADGGGYMFCGNTVFGQNGANAGSVLNAGFSYRSIITGNRFRNVNATVLTLGTTDADTRIRDNFGYVTQAQGTATILSATTSITVTHGLARTPNIAGIQAIAQASPGGDLWISGVTSTQFTINISAAPGSNLAVSWSADAVIG